MIPSTINSEMLVFDESPGRSLTQPPPAEPRQSVTLGVADQIVLKVAQEVGIAASIIRRVIERVSFHSAQLERSQREKDLGPDATTPGT